MFKLKGYFRRKYMIFGSPRCQNICPICFDNNSTLFTRKQFIFLGQRLDECRSWKKNIRVHVMKQCKAAIWLNALLAQIEWYIPPVTSVRGMATHLCTKKLSLAHVVPAEWRKSLWFHYRIWQICPSDQEFSPAALPDEEKGRMRWVASLSVSH